MDVFGTVVGKDVEILWSEQGGPDVVPPTAVVGYGSQFIRRTMQGTLGGSISFDWPRSGAQVSMKISEERLAL